MLKRTLITIAALNILLLPLFSAFASDPHVVEKLSKINPIEEETPPGEELPPGPTSTTIKPQPPREDRCVMGQTSPSTRKSCCTLDAGCGAYKKGDCIDVTCTLTVIGSYYPAMAACKYDTQCPANRLTSGCFTSDTLITMADGSQKEIRNVARGQSILDPLSGQPRMVREVVAGPESIPVIEISAAGKTLRVTQEHPMVVDTTGEAEFRSAILSRSDKVTSQGLPGSGEIVKARDLRVGSRILLSDGTYAPIEALKRLALSKGEDVVYNIELETPSGAAAQHLLIANGVVTGDLLLQRKGIAEEVMEKGN